MKLYEITITEVYIRIITNIYHCILISNL